MTRGLRLQPVELNLTDASQNKSEKYDAYERLLLDAINGDQTLFMRRDEVETAWRWTDSIIAAGEANGTSLKHDHSGTVGHYAAAALIAVDGR